jgi:uncharacterized OB-fold protein
MTAERVPVIEGLFAETAAGPRLLGSRCPACGTPYFPRSPRCHAAGCAGGKTEDAAFGPRGVLWSFTVQHFAPPAPVLVAEPFEPYAVGMVDLADGLRVLGRVAAPDPSALHGGMELELVLAPLRRDEQGRELVSWMFRPCARAGATEASR